jgi:tRNA A-37 threonylcarbamoyl transferase component Bud32/tetratricopeptide (TPR) repeat protein
MEKKLSHYTILEELGRGGMGIVYKARDERLERIVALKVLAGELADDQKFRERFLKEARLASLLQHPRICTIHEINTTEDGQLFISMDYYEGETLQQKIFKGIDSLDVMLDYAIQLSEGIAAAHKKGVIHRDIKPENVIITTEGEVKILDFGMSKLTEKYISTQTSRILGSVSYISPEQVQGQQVDLLTDIWSFGVVLYEMATGILPFRHDSQAAIIYSILDKSPVPPTEINEDLPDQLESLIFQCLRKNKEERYQSMDEVIQELLTLRKGLNNTETLDKAVEQEQKRPSGKRRLKVRDIVIVAVLIVAGILVFPRISNSRSDIMMMTIPVTVVNEFGEKETKRVFKEEYLSRIVVFPFVNAEQDSSANWIEDVIFDAVLEDYAQFNNIIVHSSDNTVHLNEQIKYAKTGNASHFLTGSYRMDQGNYELTSKLYQAENGALLMERTYIGKDLLNLLDSVCHDSRNDIGISDDLLNSIPDLPIAEMTTHNLNAYRYYAGGFGETGELTRYFSKSFQLDSTFASALYRRARQNWTFSENHRSALNDIDQAMRHRKRLSNYKDILTRQLYYEIHGETEKAIALAKMQVELHPYDYRFLESLAFTYLRFQLHNQAEEALQELNELVPDQPFYKGRLAKSLLINGKYSKGLETLDQWLLDDPLNTDALLLKGEFYLHMKDFKAAEEVIKRAILITPEEADKFSLLLDHIEYIQNNKMSKSLLESYTGKYRREVREQYISFSINNDQLYIAAEHQPGFFGYPVSDTVVVSVIIRNDDKLFVTQSLFRDKNGNVAGSLIRQSNAPNITMWAWKEYPLILKAEKLLSDDKLTEALDTFLLARDEYPAHYYLSNYIQHLEYIQNREDEELDSLFKSYAGEYNDSYLYTEDHKFFYREPEGSTYELLPLTDSTFRIKAAYCGQVQMVSDGSRKTGMKIVLRLYRGDYEEYHPRNPDLQTNRTPN